MSVRWLAPSVVPEGVQLIRAERRLVAGCGPYADCFLTVPSARLVYDTDDLTAGRWFDITQTLASPGDFQFGTGHEGEERKVGDRTVAVDEHELAGRPFSINAGWTEPDGNIVRIRSTGLDWDDVAAMIRSLERVDPGEWPGAVVHERLKRCVDARTQYAPADVPDGWVRYVLEAQPTGTCGTRPFLAMSLVVPGTEDGPGTLVYFSTVPASDQPPAVGEAVTVNGHPATVHAGVGADGEPFASIELRIDAVSIGAHGNVDRETLLDLAETIAPLTDDEWAALVADVATPDG